MAAAAKDTEGNQQDHIWYYNYVGHLVQIAKNEDSATNSFCFNALK